MMKKFRLKTCFICKKTYLERIKLGRTSRSRNICPECKENAWWRKLSSGGDGLYFCTKCNWVEDATKPIKTTDNRT